MDEEKEFYFTSSGNHSSSCCSNKETHKIKNKKKKKENQKKKKKKANGKERRKQELEALPRPTTKSNVPPNDPEEASQQFSKVKRLRIFNESPVRRHGIICYPTFSFLHQK